MVIHLSAGGVSFKQVHPLGPISTVLLFTPEEIKMKKMPLFYIKFFQQINEIMESFL